MVTKAILVCFVCLICTSIIKEHSSGFAIMLTISGVMTLFFLINPYIIKVISIGKRYVDMINIDAKVFIPLAKVVIIALTTRLTAEICRDGGERALGYKIEIIGIIAGTICSFPLLDKALTLIGDM